MPETRPLRQLVSSGSPYEAPIGFSRAVRVGDHVVVAGTAPVWPDGHVDPDVERQAERCLEIMLAALPEAGATAGDVIRTRSYLVAAVRLGGGRPGPRPGLRARPTSLDDGRGGGPPRPSLEGGDGSRGHHRQRRGGGQGVGAGHAT